MRGLSILLVCAAFVLSCQPEGSFSLPSLEKSFSLPLPVEKPNVSPCFSTEIPSKACILQMLQNNGKGVVWVFDKPPLPPNADLNNIPWPFFLIFDPRGPENPQATLIIVAEITANDLHGLIDFQDLLQNSSYPESPLNVYKVYNVSVQEGSIRLSLGKDDFEDLDIDFALNQEMDTLTPKKATRNGLDLDLHSKTNLIDPDLPISNFVFHKYFFPILQNGSAASSP